MTDTIAHYYLEYGSYYLRSRPGGSILLMCDQVTFVYSAKDGYMLKHGDRQGCLRWWEAERDKARPLFGELVVATLPPRYPVKEINQALDFKNVRQLTTANLL